MLNRRDFIIIFLRRAALLLLVFLSGFLMLRKDEGEKSCDVRFSCQKCSKQQGCTLPQAIDFRKNKSLE